MSIKNKMMKFFRLLPKDSCIVHSSMYNSDIHNSNNSDVSAWVRSLQYPIKKNDTMEETSMKKYLISDLHTAAGFEAPAVIIVTYSIAMDSGSPSYAVYCMRAKAQLVVCKWN